MTDWVRTTHLEMGYEADGPDDGPAVVAVHGWPDGPRTWDGVLPDLLDAGCRVYRPYLRGCGPTRFLRDDSPRSGQVTALCADLVAFLDALGLEDPVLAGHDWGARTGYALAALHPDRLAGLVAMSVGYGGTGPASPPTPAQALAYWYQWYFTTTVGRRGLAEDRRGICRELWRTWSPSYAFTDAEFDRTATAWDNPDWHDVTVHSYSQRWGEADGDPDLAALEERLAGTPPIRTPTIVLHGEDDGATLPAATDTQDHLFTTSYDRRTLPGVGHFVPREAPRAAAQAILDLVGRR